MVKPAGATKETSATARNPVYQRDVATAKQSVEDDRVDMRFWLRGRDVPKATVVIGVYRQAGANAVEVAQSVRDLVPVVKATIPPSIDIVPIYARSLGIVNSANDVKETL